jgi:hypothetical protein
MLEPKGTGTTAAGDQAVRDLIGPFVFNNDFCQITAQDLAVVSLLVGLDHCGVDKRSVLVIVHENSDAGNGEGVVILKNRTVTGLADFKCYFGKSHGYLCVNGDEKTIYLDYYAQKL